MSSAKNVLYAQSGGVTAVLNASACGVIETARRHGDRVGKVLAGRNGIMGVLAEDLVDTYTEDTDSIAALRHTPSGAFGSCRYKLPGLQDHRPEYERLMDVFRAHDIAYFLYNGGGDSADTCHRIARFAQQAGFPVQTIHIPKTVDNDLPCTDVSPGFGSVAKYVAVSVREACFDVRAMAHSSTKVFVMEVMGRHAGWIAAAGGLAEEAGQPLPLLILFPEVKFDQAKFLARVKKNVETQGYCTVVVSEGVRWPDGRFLSDQGTQDAFGHAQLGGAAVVIVGMIKEQFGYKQHWAVADYLQRAARHIASRTDVEQSYAVGRAAVELALQGENAIMPTIVRKSDSPYAWELGQAALEQVANQERKMPREYISTDGFSITPSCRRYLAPLIVGEDYPPFQQGLPEYVNLRNAPMAKKLLPYQTGRAGA